MIGIIIIFHLQNSMGLAKPRAKTFIESKKVCLFNVFESYIMAILICTHSISMSFSQSNKFDVAIPGDYKLYQ